MLLSTTLIALGFDAGSRTLGWAALRFDPGGAVYLDSGTIEIGHVIARAAPMVIATAAGPRVHRNETALDDVDLARLAGELAALRARFPAELVVVECVRKVKPRPGMGSSMATHLACGSHVAGEVCGTFRAAGARVVTLTYEQGRQALRLPLGATAAEQRGDLRRRVEGWPERGGDVHGRDAGLVLLAAVAIERGALLAAAA